MRSTGVVIGLLIVVLLLQLYLWYLTQDLRQDLILLRTELRSLTSASTEMVKLLRGMARDLDEVRRYYLEQSFEVKKLRRELEQLSSTVEALSEYKLSLYLVRALSIRTRLTEKCLKLCFTEYELRKVFTWTQRALKSGVRYDSYVLKVESRSPVLTYAVKLLALVHQEIRYIPDTPHIYVFENGSVALVKNYVQTPSETLERRAGDCEDMSILLLASLIPYCEGLRVELYLLALRFEKGGHVISLLKLGPGKYCVLDPTSGYFTGLEESYVTSTGGEFVLVAKPTAGTLSSVLKLYLRSAKLRYPTAVVEVYRVYPGPPHLILKTSLSEFLKYSDLPS